MTYSNRNKLLFVLRKLTMEENYRLEKEEKLSKADEKINHAAEELETYRYEYISPLSFLGRKDIHTKAQKQKKNNRAIKKKSPINLLFFI